MKSVQIAGIKAGPFSHVEHLVVGDEKGELGRGRARNLGIDETMSEWVFFLDADDVMRPDALTRVQLDAPATFGALSKDGRPYRLNVYPCSWRELALYGASGTLVMGFFCKTEVANNLRFNEEMMIGEDYDFYMRLPSFVKVTKPLIDIGHSALSAGGPRSPDDFGGRKGKSNWTYVCNERIVAAYDQDPDKFGISRDALLAAAPRFARNPDRIPGLVRATA